MAYPLAVTRIFPYEEFREIASGYERGVYIWGFRFFELGFERFLPYYVGKGDRTPIKTRIDGHYHFKGNYHIIRSAYLHEYFKLWKSKADIKRMDRQELANYSQMFAYLNYEYGGKRPNNLAAHKAGIEAEIKYYQDNFYCCYIPTNDLMLSRADESVVISKLEKHVTASISHIIAGDTKPLLSTDFSIDTGLLGSDNFIRNFNLIGFSPCK